MLEGSISVGALASHGCSAGWGLAAVGVSEPEDAYRTLCTFLFPVGYVYVGKRCKCAHVGGGASAQVHMQAHIWRQEHSVCHLLSFLPSCRPGLTNQKHGASVFGTCMWVLFGWSAQHPPVFTPQCWSEAQVVRPSPLRLSPCLHGKCSYPAHLASLTFMRSVLTGT